MKINAVSYICFFIILLSPETGLTEMPALRPADSTFYVSVDGNDSGLGSKTDPWKSPAYASRQLQPGDTLIILPGRYFLNDFEKDIVLPPSGLKDRWITIKGSSVKNRPIFIGQNNLLSAIDLSGVHFIKLENLVITTDENAFGSTRWFRDGISAVDANCSNIELKNLYIHHIDEFGLNVKDIENLKITSCVFEYCGFGAVGGPDGNKGGLRNIEISDCRLSYSGHYYRGGNGTDRPYDRPDGFGNEQSVGPILISDTIAEHNYGDGIDSKSKNTSIDRCVIANNTCDGVKLWGGNSRISNTLIYGTGDAIGGDSPWAGIVVGTSEKNAEFEIINVTLHDNPARKAYSMYVQYDDPQIPVTVHLQNSIISNAFGVAYFAPSVNLICNNNIFNRNDEKVQVVARGREYTNSQLDQLGANNLSGNPRFIRTAWGEPGDYQLKKNSPAIDSGSFISPLTKDIEGIERSNANTFDIGAYEWNRTRKTIKKPRNTVATKINPVKVKISWDKSVVGDSQQVTAERSEKNGEEWREWMPVGAVKARKGKYVDSGLDIHKSYRYRLYTQTFSRASKFSKTIIVQINR